MHAKVNEDLTLWTVPCGLEPTFTSFLFLWPFFHFSLPF